MAAHRCAHIVNGVVTNTMVADPATFSFSDGSLVVATDTAQVGDTYANGTFTTVTPPTVYQTTGLSFIQFMSLFTPAEQTAIVASNDTNVKLFCLMAAGAAQIDLPNPEVLAGVNYLTSINIITSARATTILSGE